MCGHELIAATNLAVPLFERAPGGEIRATASDILRLQALFEGECKHITVLFADIVASSRLILDTDPEDAHDRLLPPLESMMDAVCRYGGTVNQVLGDGIMALFGAPVAQEDHAIKACLAALAMQDAVGHANNGGASSGDDAMRLRVGLNSGMVVVRAFENDIHIDYRAFGETVYTAARMESCASPGRVALTGNTYRLAKRYVEAKPLDCLHIKETPPRVEAFELTRPRRHRERPHFPPGRVLPHFVGRQAEMNSLRRALERAMTGNGQAVAIVGEPGVGKSRLFQEFLNGVNTDEWTVLRCSLMSHHQATLDRPAAQLIKTIVDIGDSDEAHHVAAKVARRLCALNKAPGHFGPALLALLGVASENDDWQALDPRERHRHILEAFVGLLTHESLTKPIIVVIEDLHHVDSATQALIDALVERLSSARILVLLNYRLEYRQEWSGTPGFAEHRIDPLSADEAAELLGEHLGSDTSLDPLKRLLIEKTDGVPFFVEESVRSLIESKALMGSPGAYRLAAPMPTLQVPATVQAVLAARIDRLAPGDKRFLLTAAVIGKNVNVALLRDVANMSNEAFRESLQRLRASEFLDPSRHFPQAELAFRHALTHEVAYRTLLHARRRTLHARIVSAIESRDAGRLDEHLEPLAHHAYEGELWEKAVIYFRAAGHQALSRSANQEAAALFEKALKALGRLPKDRKSTEEAIDLWIDRGNSVFPLGDQEQILDCIRRATSLCESLGDRRRLGKAASLLTTYNWMVGSLDQATKSAVRAKEVAEGLGDIGFWINANARIGMAHLARGEFRRACNILSDVLERPECNRIEERFGLAGNASVICLASLARAHAELGEFDEAIALGKKGIRIAEKTGHAFSRVYADFYVGVVYLRREAIEKAIPMLERGLKRCEATGVTLLYPLGAAALGHAYMHAGRTAAAIRLLEQAVNEAETMKLVVRLSLMSVWLGEAYLRCGRLHDAMRSARRGLDLSRYHSERGHEASALRLLGEVFACSGPQNKRRSYDFYQQAIGKGESLGMRPLLAHCHFGLGKLLCRYRELGEPLRELGAAMALYRAMGMIPCFEEAEAMFAGAELELGGKLSEAVRT